jgi:hypothetical protein
MYGALHLDQVFLICGYLKRNKRATIVFAESKVSWNETSFESHDWGTFIGVQLNRSHNAPLPRGKITPVIK